MAEYSRTYKDALDREFTVEISTAVLRRLAAPPLAFTLDQLIPADVDETKPDAFLKKYQAFLDDDLRFADVLFAILKPAKDGKPLTQEEFEEGLKGGANRRAIAAFHAAYTDFSHAPRRTVLRGLQLQMEKEATYHEIAERKIKEEVGAVTEAKMEKVIDGLISVQRGKRDKLIEKLAVEGADPSSKSATDTAAVSV